jgi:hypothetical protein
MGVRPSQKISILTKTEMLFIRPNTLLRGVIVAAMAAGTAPISRNTKKGTGKRKPGIVINSLHKSTF